MSSSAVIPARDVNAKFFERVCNIHMVTYFNLVFWKDWKDIEAFINYLLLLGL